MIRDYGLQEEVCNLYSKIAGKCLNDNTPIQGYQKEWATQILQSCIALCLTKSEDIDECRAEIEGILKESSKYDDIKQIISVDNAYKNASIRRNFAAAFEKVKHGCDLSGILGYGFSNGDLTNLAILHKENQYRDKIEDLLTDCNFHEECEMMSSGDYSMWLEADA